MGFDLYGVNAKSKNGEYFRNNCWWWRPLASYVLENCEVSSPDDWGFNNGKKVGEKEATKIGNRLTELLKNGDVKKYEKRYNAELKKLPLETCKYCEGTGKRKDISNQDKCNVCNGKGKVKNLALSYPFEEANVKEFAKFCLESGGFEIY